MLQYTILHLYCMLLALQYPLPIPQDITQKTYADGIGIFDFALQQTGGSVVEHSKTVTSTQYGIWSTPLLSVEGIKNLLGDYNFLQVNNAIQQVGSSAFFGACCRLRV